MSNQKTTPCPWCGGERQKHYGRRYSCTNEDCPIYGIKHTNTSMVAKCRDEHDALERKYNAATLSQSNGHDLIQHLRTLLNLTPDADVVEGVKDLQSSCRSSNTCLDEIAEQLSRAISKDLILWYKAEKIVDELLSLRAQHEADTELIRELVRLYEKDVEDTVFLKPCGHHRYFIADGNCRICERLSQP